MDYSEFLGKNLVVGDNGLLTNRPEVIVVDTSAAVSASVAREKAERLMEARKQIALENIAANRLPEWLPNLDLSALEEEVEEEVVYEGERILEQ